MEPYIEKQQYEPDSGLLRFRSAPSSLFSSFTAGFDFNQQHIHTPTPVDPPGKSLPRFLEFTNGGGAGAEDSSSASFETKPFLVDSRYGSYQQLPQYTEFPLEGAAGSVAAAVVDHHHQSTQHQRKKRIGGSGGSKSNLARQSSSPAGLFSHLNSPTGYNMMRGGGVSSSVGHLPRIPESTKETETTTTTTTTNSSPDVRDGDRYRNGEEDNHDTAAAQFYGTTNGFSFGSWNDHSTPTGNPLSELKTHNQQNDSGSEGSPTSQSGSVLNRQMMSHHLSLPRKSADKLLNFQDATVPCKIRAKRGCATHPRSIAERVRRTRISEKMKKLQDLVPNMDKQINTSDMLDLAVDYIKDLQTHHKMLADRRAICRCLNGQQHHYAASHQAL